MKTLIELVQRFEGLHKVKADGQVHPYICPAGYATQGYGLLVKDMQAQPISKSEAYARMVRALPVYVKQTLELCPGLLKAPPDVLWAITDFTFNLGPGRLKASTLRKRLNEEDWDGARAELGKWVMGGGRKLPGLVLRRAVEAAIIERATS